MAQGAILEVQTKNIYRRRIAKEDSISEQEIVARARWDMPILSENSKCSCSLDLPLKNCRPTAVCKQVCYAAQGRQYYRQAVVKSLAVSRLINQDAQRAAQQMAEEAEGCTIRLAGSGELLPGHKTLVTHLDAYKATWWGFTRRVDTHKAMPELMFSVDASTPPSVLAYVHEHVPVAHRAYLLLPDEATIPLDVAVTFPVHGAVTPYVKRTAELGTDCPSTRKEVSGCWMCKRCY